MASASRIVGTVWLYTLCLDERERQRDKEVKRGQRGKERTKRQKERTKRHRSGKKAAWGEGGQERARSRARDEKEEGDRETTHTNKETEDHRSPKYKALISPPPKKSRLLRSTGRRPGAVTETGTPHHTVHGASRSARPRGGPEKQRHQKCRNGVTKVHKPIILIKKSELTYSSYGSAVRSKSWYLKARIKPKSRDVDWA